MGNASDTRNPVPERCAAQYRTRGGRMPRRCSRSLLYILLDLTAFVVAMPFVIMVLTSFKLPNDIITYPPRLLPTEWTLSNYQSDLDAAARLPS